MLVFITYDVSTVTHDGRRRLQRVAKCCEGHGIRVQNSVFECVLDAAQFTQFKHTLEQLIDPTMDSLRFYNLGNRTQRNVVHVGAKPAIDMEKPLILSFG
ncbi:MAG: CRISPR-associated endonuclease Cas2 [Clostridia bacterium]